MSRSNYDLFDDDDLVVVDPPSRSRSRLGAYDTSERYGPPARIEGNNYLSPDTVSILPGVLAPRSPSRHSRRPSRDRRTRSRRRSDSSSSSSSSDDGYGGTSYHHHHRHSSRSGSSTNPDLAVQLAKLQLLEEAERKRQEQERIRREVKEQLERRDQLVVGNRPNFIRIHRSKLSIQTLEVYSLPWEWDEVSRVISLTPLQLRARKLTPCPPGS